MARGTASPKAAIFDMDGVLVDSGEAHYRAWRAICRERGRELDRDMFRDAMGTGTALTVKMFFGDGLDPGEVAAMAIAKEAAFRREVEAGVVSLFDGGSELVRALKAAGWRLALGTSAPRANMESVMARFPAAGLLSVKVCEDMVADTKPAPDVFLKAADLCGVPPSRAVVIEDSASGLEAARRGGIAAVGVVTTLGREELMPLARLVVGTLGELTPEILDRVLGG